MVGKLAQIIGEVRGAAPAQHVAYASEAHAAPAAAPVTQPGATAQSPGCSTRPTAGAAAAAAAAVHAAPTSNAAPVAVVSARVAWVSIQQDGGAGGATGRVRRPAALRKE